MDLVDCRGTHGLPCTKEQYYFNYMYFVVRLYNGAIYCVRLYNRLCIF